MTGKVAVIGAGSWGTALARVLGGNGHPVRLWARETEVVSAVNERHENPLFLPDTALPETIVATSRLAEALDGASLVVSVVPAQFAGAVWAEADGALAAGAYVVNASKGIEVDSLRTMDEVIEEALGSSLDDRFAVISGPSFAAEVAAESPTLVVAASRSETVASEVQRSFQNEYFRVYTHTDVTGVEVAGALKNVMAIAAGVAAGLGFGHNTRAALITRGLDEMARLGVAMGGRRDTFSGLAGMGDLVLTCTGDLSRNRTVGVRIGRGESIDVILAPGRSVAEGVKTVRAVRALAAEHGVPMPIVEEVHAMLFDRRPPREALRNLMTREPKSEEWE